MYKLQVTADKLNIRNSPDADPLFANWVGDMLRGEEFDAVDIVKGTVYEGSNLWYVDNYRRYVSLVGTGDNDPRIGWNLRSLGVPHLWNKTKGEGIKVAIIDSGIDLKNKDLSAAVSVANCFNILDDSSDVQDVFDHGSFCASVLASRGINPNGMKGVAPACEVVVIKIANEFKDYFNEANQLKAIQKAIELKSHIITMSFGNRNSSDAIQNVLINTAIRSGIICIASTGDQSNEPNVEYPANYKGMISVGSVSCSNASSAQFGEGIFTQSNDSTGGLPDAENEGVTIVAPGDMVSGYNSKGQVKTITGTSFAAPYVAGVAALWLSIMKGKQIPGINYHKAFKDFILSQANTKFNRYDPEFSGAGMLTPISILSI